MKKQARSKEAAPFAHGWRVLAAAVVVTFALAACAASGPVQAEEPAASREPTFQSFHDELALGMVDAAQRFKTDSLRACLDASFHAYVTGRMVEVPPSGRDPLAFGPWSATKDYYAADAPADGSLAEWSDDYFIAHDWSDTGQQILALEPGDTVSVNGREVRVEGVFNYPKSSFYDEIAELVGTDAVVFQTCYPESDYNRIAYGH